jgi:AAA domain
MTTSAELARQLQAKGTGPGAWIAKCPAHEDRTASLSIGTGEDGRLLMNCFAGCDFADILKAAGVEPTKPNGEGRPGKPRIVATYDYRDVQGDVVFQVVRMTPKDFRQRRPDGKGGWIWGRGDTPALPYRLPELIEASEVYICEGEKDCDRLAKLGVVATTNPGGADRDGDGGKKWPAGFARYFDGRHAILIPDNDDPGRRHVQAVAKKLSGTAASIRILELPGLPDKGDVTDWLTAGGTADELRRLAEAAPGWNGEAVDQVDSEATDPAPGRLRLVPPSEMDWRGAQLNLVKGILGFGMMALLYGASGSAKTLIALSLALHVALGRAWCGRKVKQGFVAYLAPEGGHSVHLRFHAWCRHQKLDPSDDRLAFRTVPVRVDLCKSAADLKEIIANIKATEPELGSCILVVVDTVSRALDGGDENSPADMGNFVANCDRMREATGATVLGVHHTPAVGDNPRGHTCLKNGSEIRMLAKKVASGLFSLNLEHLKDGAAGDELLFELKSAVVGENEDGEDVSGGLVVETSFRPARGGGGDSKKLTERQMRILQELRKEAATTKKWDFTAEDFNELCIRSGAVDRDKPDNSKRARISELKLQLANRGLVTVNGDIVRLVMPS